MKRLHTKHPSIFSIRQILGLSRSFFNQPLRAGCFFVFLTLSVRLIWLADKGLTFGQDTPGYLEAGQMVLENPLNIQWFIDYGLAPYFNFLLILGTLIFLFGGQVLLAWILLQIIAASLAAMPLYLLARRAAGGPAALLVGFIYAFLFELSQWDRYLLSDSLGYSVTIFVAYFAWRAWEQKTTSAWILFGASLFFLALLRPPGFFVAVTLVAWLVAVQFSGMDVSTSRLRQLAVGIALIGALGFVLLSALYLLDQTDVGPFMAGYYEQGGVLFGDPYYDHAVAIQPYREGSIVDFLFSNPIAFFSLVFRKLGVFWAVAPPRYSFLHKAVNYGTLLPIILLGFSGMFYVLWKKRSHPELILPIFLVVSLNFIHAILWVDFDFRYRVPTLPFLSILSAMMAVRIGGRIIHTLRSKTIRIQTQNELAPD